MRGKRGMLGLVVAGALGFGPATGADAAMAPLGQYGTTGSGPGQIETPLDVAIDPATGDVYVADDDNSRIDVFAPDGTFLRAFGKDVDPGGGAGLEVCTASCQAGDDGTAAGELDDIEGVEVSPAGEVFVADYGADRISVFGRDGTFRRAFGADVVPGGGTGFEICTDVCKAGVSDDGPGELFAPWGMAVGTDGTLYVTDVGNARVNAYAAATGEFRFSFGAGVVPGGPNGFEVCTTSCTTGLSNGTAGSLASPEGLDFDPQGNLLIAEYTGDRISVVGLEGGPQFLRAYGKDVLPGGGTGFEVCTTDCQSGDSDQSAGALNQAQGIAVDALGTAYVADAGNNRISIFDPSPSFVGAFGADVVPGTPSGFETCTVATGCQEGAPGALPGELAEPYAPADDCRGNVYVTDVGNDRIQRFGEPGTGLGPCELSLASTKRKRNGTARLTVEVPGPGVALVSGKGVKRSRVTHEGFIGPESLKVKPKRKLKKKLKRKGKAKVKLTVGYEPSAYGYEPASLTKQLKLKRKRR